MQGVYKDGSGGKIKPFDQQMLEKVLQNPMVDHVEVFALGSEAHKRAVGRIENLTVSRREKKRLKKILRASTQKAAKG